MIRKADKDDLKPVADLLLQVCSVHAQGRPDLFKGGARKYTDEELLVIFRDEKTPVFVYEDESGAVTGYAFCIIQDTAGSNMLVPHKTLYIDDLCVDEKRRGQGIGRALYNHCVEYAKANGCYNITLNVWALNSDAREFYRKLGMQVQKIGMETIL